MTREEFEKYQEHSFDVFCLRVIDNEAASIQREIAIRKKYEKPLEELSMSELEQLFTEDQYDLGYSTFSVRGESVIVHDPELALALQSIMPKMRDLILLFYFLGKTETQIGNTLGLDRSVINRHHFATLRLLREIIEDMKNESPD